MIASKLIRISQIITPKNPLFSPHGRSRRSSSPGQLCVTLCSSKNGGSSSNSEGDVRKQELLVRIVMLQAQKIRLTDFLDERSAYLTQFAEEANAEIDAIGESALKDLDQAASRIMESIESKMQAFEESLEQEKQETQKRDQELEEFEGEIEKGRNQGMFFQSFQQRRKPIDRVAAKMEAEKITDLTRRSTAASKARRSIYLALIGILAAGIVDSLVFYRSNNWSKIGVFGLILTALVSQFVYEQKMLPKDDEETK